MAIASGTDGHGSTWIAVYCDGCSASISSEKLDLHELRRAHGWHGSRCPRCLDQRDSFVSPAR